MPALIVIALVVILILWRKKKKQANIQPAAVVRAYIPPAPFTDDPIWGRQNGQAAEEMHAFRGLRDRYDKQIKLHKRLEDKIARTYSAAREFKDFAGPEMREVIDLCRQDIALAPDLRDYTLQWEGLLGQPVSLPAFDSFRRLAIIYEKQGDYSSASSVCQEAVRLGYDRDGALRDRMRKLQEKQSKKENAAPARSAQDGPYIAPATKQVNTTRAEMEAFTIVQGIAAEHGLQDRISYKDTLSYFTVLLDGMSRKWILRISLDGSNKWVSFHPQPGRTPEKIVIGSARDLYGYRDAILSTISMLSMQG